jgi:hypothetical protein
MGADSGDGTSVDTASLSDAAVALLSGRNAFVADTQLAKVTDDTQRQAVSLLA